MDSQIRDIVDSAVNSLSKVAEANTIIGDTIVAPDGTLIMPISQLNFVFVAGGGEYGKGQKKSLMKEVDNVNFAGASGGGATLTPVGFLVVSKDGVKVINTAEESNLTKLLDVIVGLGKNEK